MAIHFQSLHSVSFLTRWLPAYGIFVRLQYIRIFIWYIPGRTCGYRCTTLFAASKVAVESILIFCVLSEGQTNYSNAFVWQQIFSKNNFRGADKLQK